MTAGKLPASTTYSWESPRRKSEEARSLPVRGYCPLPLRRIYIPKANGKLRPLWILTMRDRAMQALHLLALDPIAETTADNASYRFRTARSCADAIERCFVSLSRRHTSVWILEGDLGDASITSATSGYSIIFLWTDRFSANGCNQAI